MKRIFIICVTIILACLATHAKTEHIIERGETIESIAKKYGISVEALYKANSDLKDLFFVGMSIQIPDKLSVETGRQQEVSSDSEKKIPSEISQQSNVMLGLDEDNNEESPKLTLETEESDWQKMISDFDQCLYFEFIRDGSIFNNSKETYHKALKLMRQNKREKALNYMEKLAISEKYEYLQTDAIYQLLYYKKFNDFDYYLGDHNEKKKGSNIYQPCVVFGDNILSSNDFPVVYEISSKNNKKKKEVRIEDCSDKIILALLPLHGKIQLALTRYYKEKNSYSSIRIDYDDLFLSSLKELCSRSVNGIPYSEDLKLDESSISIFSNRGVEGAIEVDNLEPLLRHYSKSNYNGFNLTGAELFALGASATETMVACHYYARAAMKGYAQAFQELLLNELDFREKENAIALQSTLDTNIFRINRIRESGKFNMYTSYIEKILNELEEYKKKVDVYAEAERKEQLRIEKELEEKRNQELLAAQQAREQEKREKRARIFNAIGQVVNLAAQTYMAVQTNKAISETQSGNGFGRNVAPGGAVRSTGGSNIEQQLNNPNYYKGVMQQIMNASIMQVQQEEMAEYQQARQYNPNLTLDEFRQMKAQAYMVTRNQELNSIDSQNSNDRTTSDNSTRHSSYNQGHYKDCHLCRGTGVCSTCNGKRTVTNWGKTSECPNCLLENMRRTGKCSGCSGTGKRFTTTQ